MYEGNRDTNGGATDTPKRFNDKDLPPPRMPKDLTRYRRLWKAMMLQDPGAGFSKPAAEDREK